MDLPILIGLFLLGLCVGSFCNVLIYRIPKGEEFVKTFMPVEKLKTETSEWKSTEIGYDDEVIICRRCHRKLKDAESKKLGFGKTCYKKYCKRKPIQDGAGYTPTGEIAISDE